MLVKAYGPANRYTVAVIATCAYVVTMLFVMSKRMLYWPAALAKSLLKLEIMT